MKCSETRLSDGGCSLGPCCQGASGGSVTFTLSRYSVLLPICFRLAVPEAPSPLKTHLSGILFGVPPISKPTCWETIAPSEEAQPTLRPWTGFEPERLETPRTPKHCILFYREELSENVQRYTVMDVA
ncbi:hypothetical protein E2C01_056371 [Portunus trituberculatus]|uniref:Uncharacterized protein n=1 Tax=Portunus trituberculatus TaxID=210409 RepID=A0A5B7GZF8_PORTR|nr:hypothetical protein [Portunus trituberculatus]